MSGITSRTMREWSIGEELSESELRQVSEGVFQHGRAQAEGGNATPLGCIVREDGVVIAGGSGRTEFGRLFVQDLWVEQLHRGRGLGTEVLARIETAARERGCLDALIETLDDRVAKLYSRLGYEPLAVVPRYVGAFTRHILLKPLVEAP